VTKKKIPHRQQVRYVGAHPLYHPWSQRGVFDPIKLAYNAYCRKASSQQQVP